MLIASTTIVLPSVKSTTAFSVRVALRLALLTPADDGNLEDLPMNRVKFNVNTEYAYLQNFKILQSTSSALPCRTMKLIQVS